MSFLRELIRFMFKRKKYWLIPIVLILTLLGGLLIVSQGSIIAPFIYTLW
ncbi:DUF5989 family protein [Candidatus Pelagibacter bacterium]|nr:DUF5989 family protein [Candidatus Pelagibacter bacterium]